MVMKGNSVSNPFSFRCSFAVAPDGAEAEPGADAARRAGEAERDEGGRPRVGAQGQPEDARPAWTAQHAAGRRGEAIMICITAGRFYFNLNPALFR